MVTQIMKDGTSTTSGATQKHGLVGPRGNQVLLQHQLQGVGHRLEQAHGPCAGRAQPPLEAAQELALHPRQGQHHDGQGGEEHQQPQEYQQEVYEGHLSTSPSTMSREPSITTASASHVSFSSTRRALRLQKEGGRTLTL